MRNNISKKRWAYLAGLIDGDGSIYLYEHQSPKQKHFFFKVRVGSTNRSTINWLIQQFGGTLKKGPAPRPNENQTFDWEVSGIHARRILEGIQEFTVQKPEQVKLGIEYLSIPFDLETPELRSKYASQLAQVNSFFLPVEVCSSKELVSKPSELPKTALAYLAGIIDSEGTISLPAPSAKSPQVQVSNTDMRILSWLYSVFGGVVFAGEREQENRRPYGLWRFSGGRCQKIEYVEATRKSKELLLLAILPYLRTKKSQAVVALACLRNEKPTSFCFEQLKTLNKVGTSKTNTPNDSKDESMIESDLHSDMQRDLVVTLEA